MQNFANAPPKSYRDILVVGITADLQMRQVFEEVLCVELRKRGVKATPSYTVSGPQTALSRAVIEQAVLATAVDTVLTARLVDLLKKSHTDVGYTMTSRGVDSFVGFDTAGTVSYATFDLKPVEVTTSKTYALESNLFDTATQKLVWTGMTDSVNPGGVVTLSTQYAGVVINRLHTEGRLP